MAEPIQSPEQLLQRVQNLTETQNRLLTAIEALERRGRDPLLNFKIPDQIKIIPEFNGNRKQTLAWVEDTQQTLELFEEYELEPCYPQILRVIRSKIVGEAREVLIASGNPREWNEIKEVLLNAFGDKRDITSHIQSLFYVKQGTKTLNDYFHKVKAIDTAIKSTAAQMNDYKGSIEAVNKLISLMTLTRYIDGLNGETLAMYVRSYKPSTLEDAHEITIQHSNASLRQKMENRQSYPNHPISKPNPKFQYNKKENPIPHPQPTIPKPNSGRFRKPNTQEDDVSMKTHVSRMQLNNHEGENSKKIVDPESDDDHHEDDTSKIDSDDDDYFVGDEINFQLVGPRKAKG